MNWKHNFTVHQNYEAQAHLVTYSFKLIDLSIVTFSGHPISPSPVYIYSCKRSYKRTVMFFLLLGKTFRYIQLTTQHILTLDFQLIRGFLLGKKKKIKLTYYTTCMNPNPKEIFLEIVFLFLSVFLLFFQMSSMTVVITTSNVSLGTKGKGFNVT